ncbi:hypothetical protein FOA24_13140 [Bacillus thuringiensis]
MHNPFTYKRKNKETSPTKFLVFSIDSLPLSTYSLYCFNISLDAPSSICSNFCCHISSLFLCCNSSLSSIEFF